MEISPDDVPVESTCLERRRPLKMGSLNKPWLTYICRFFFDAQSEARSPYQICAKKGRG